MTPTLAHYDATAGAYAAASWALDMTRLRADFLALVPARARLLDAGCGSGRDAAAFAALGHEVAAFDGSVAMAAEAARRTGLPVAHRRFEEIAETEAYDGVWACASLLHVAAADEPDVLERLRRALVPGGILFCCHKQGEGERDEGARRFRDHSPASLDRVLRAAGLEPLRVWTTPDAVRPGTTWVNALSRRP